ncbi:hypothetical protein FHT87_004586 [Rhizobium sp. BK316]|uniref:hypothetical protein n=1 Tax=Rhizobium sp. BK316 TaxID=2587053 RepID=UPI0017D7DB44|nr:hypothetical protein [Rhizobium sp. BK316]MBB3410654.1 hypothetical protein [Rhizobium sp. BK316]
MLDRLAQEIVAAGEDGYKLVHLYEWLEGQILARRAVNATLDRASARVERKKNQGGGRMV